MTKPEYLSPVNANGKGDQSGCHEQLKTDLSDVGIEAPSDSDSCNTIFHRFCGWNMIDVAKALLRHCENPN